MAQTLREIMAGDPVTFETSASAQDAAVAMRERHIGDVIVTEGGRLHGIVTDRDIVTRCVASGRDPANTSLGEICSTDVITMSPSDELQSAVSGMREKAVRRVAVVEDEDRPVGVVSLGDLAVELDRRSVLGEISAAPANS